MVGHRLAIMSFQGHSSYLITMKGGDGKIERYVLWKDCALMCVCRAVKKTRIICNLLVVKQSIWH